MGLTMSLYPGSLASASSVASGSLRLATLTLGPLDSGLLAAAFWSLGWATLKMTFMLWLEQLPPTCLCRSLALLVEMK